MPAPVVCTIAANNYLAYVRAFARSFRRRHPDGRVFALLVDRPDPGIDYAAEPFEAVFVEDLGVPEFRHFAFRYSILELNTAVKPYFLQHLHRHFGVERVLYFDPDIQVLGDLGEIWRLLDESDAVLTPHITQPIEDTATPGEQDFLLSGIYNLGFLGLAINQRTLPFLDWWARRLHKLCLHEVWQGLFVDQRWMDFALAFLERVHVLRDPGYNVAYWNLMHRRLARSPAGDWTVNGAPARFFHFSGYEIEAVGGISKFQNRFGLSDRPDLAPLFDAYTQELRACGHDELRRLPYAFGAFDNGWAIPRVARWALRTVDPTGRRWPDPFAAAGSDSFFAWLAQAPDPAAVPALPRVALSLWDMRTDLRAQFPDLRGRDGEAFLEWLHSPNGRTELDRAWLREADRSLAQRPRQDSSRAHHQAVQDDGVAAGSLEAGGVVLTRRALDLYNRRRDLQLTFPELAGPARLAFAVWFVTYGRQEYGLPRTAVAPVLRSLPLGRRARVELWWARHQWRARSVRPATDEAGEDVALAPLPAPTSPGPPPWGVNVIGWASAPTGVGEACRGTFVALDGAAIPYAVYDLAVDESATAPGLRTAAAAGLPYEISLYHVNADMMANVVQELPTSLQLGRRRIGYWFWELSHFPLEFAPAFDQVDEVWAPSHFCAEAFRTIAPCPVRLVPPCVPATVAAAGDRAELGIPADAFLFYNAFDALSVPERKNPNGLLAAFRRAVENTPRKLHLLIKLSGTARGSALLQELQAACRDLPVTLLAETWPRSRVNALMATADAYVSLHRSEGLGLPLIEAMYLGKPVIATNYGGCTDFLDETTGWPVPHTLVPIAQAHGPYPPGAVWAEPDAAAAAQAMIEVATKAGEADARRSAARLRVEGLYAPAAAAARLRAELARLAPVAAPESAVPSPPAVAPPQTEEVAFTLPEAADDAPPIQRYLDLMKRTLTDIVYSEAQERGSLDGRAYSLRLRAEGRDWPRYAHTMIGLRRLDNLQHCVESALREGVAGDFVEAGVWRGGAAIFIKAVLAAHGARDRDVWLADSFRGLPRPDPVAFPADRDDLLYTKSELAISLDDVKANFRRYGLLDERVRFLEGWFKDTLPNAPISEIALLRLDADMYQSTMEALTSLYPKVSVGGFVIIDDYGAIEACRAAVTDFRAAHGLTDPIQTIDWSGVFWRRAR